MLKNNLIDNVIKMTPSGFTFPKELVVLFDYIESNKVKYFQTDIQFKKISNKTIDDYFEIEIKNIEENIYFIGTTGDGSLLGIWRNDRKQYFVHLGSEGNNWLVLATNPVDFIRLLGIGYGYFGIEEIANPPVDTSIDIQTQKWIEKTFGVNIPKTAKNIINAKESEAFNNWLQDNQD